MSSKVIALGVSGGIAAYKAAALTSMLHKNGYEVHVLMTKNATEFVSPLTFETLSGNRVSVDTFDRNFEYNVQHVALAQKADLFVVAPATANVIAKFACGIADDMLTTTFLACRCQKLICPAMNTGMLENPATQQNIQTLRSRGMQFLDAADGLLACGDVGKGRLAEPEEIFDFIEQLLSPKPLAGLKVLVTAGPTRESMDPVRFLSNHSTGKMGYALARQARNLGAEVTLVSGQVALVPVRGVRMVQVLSAADMAKAVKEAFPEQDITIKAAAVADYTFAVKSEEKLKKSDGELTLSLQRTEDILKSLGQMARPDQMLCGFAMETQNLLENARKKLEGKNADMIVANSLREAGAGFGTDTNRVTLITRDGTEPLELMEKEEVAREILARCLSILKKKRGI